MADIAYLTLCLPMGRECFLFGHFHAPPSSAGARQQKRLGESLSTITICAGISSPHTECQHMSGWLPSVSNLK